VTDTQTLEGAVALLTKLASATRAQCGLCVEALEPTARVKPVRLDHRHGAMHRAIDDVDYGCELTSREAEAVIAYDAFLALPVSPDLPADAPEGWGFCDDCWHSHYAGGHGPACPTCDCVSHNVRLNALTSAPAPSSEALREAAWETYASRLECSEGSAAWANERGAFRAGWGARR